jgi:copper resistance protein C
MALVDSSPAAADATLISVSPEHGEEVVDLPLEVVLQFSEAMSGPASVEVTTATGEPLTSGEPVVLQSTVTQPLLEAFGVGTVDIVYRLRSADGYQVEGRFVFYVRGAASGQDDGLSTPLTPVAPTRDAEAVTTEREEDRAGDDVAGSRSIW